DGMSDATTRVTNVTGVARYHVNVCVEHGLTGCRSVVEPHVEAVGVAIAQESTHLLDERPERSLLVLRAVEVAWNVTTRDDQGMAGRHGARICEGDHKRRCHQQRPVGEAERA